MPAELEPRVALELYLAWGCRRWWLRRDHEAGQIRESADVAEKRDVKMELAVSLDIGPAALLAGRVTEVVGDLARPEVDLIRGRVQDRQLARHVQDDRVGVPAPLKLAVGAQELGLGWRGVAEGQRDPRPQADPGRHVGQ